MPIPEDPHGIEHEPHLLPTKWQADPSESSVGSTLAPHTADPVERAEHTVWDESALSTELTAGIQPDVTFQTWLVENQQQTTWFDSWWITFLVALAAGPWGVLGALGNGEFGGLALLAVVIFGPVVEEITKVAAATWVIEKRPYWFQSGTQILFAAACGGLAFAAIENLLYIYVYVPQHSNEFVAFRWTVCVALHMTCSTLAGMGLRRTWSHTITHHRPPDLTLAAPWFAAAMICHGLYNLTVGIAEVSGWLELGMPENS